MVHVYGCQLACKAASGEAADEACIFICTCPAMASAWDVLTGMDTTGYTAKELVDTIKPCQHSQALQHLHANGHIPNGSCLGQPPSMLDDISFASHSAPVTVLREAPSLLLSCDFGSGQPCQGDKRGMITAESGFFKCLTCDRPTAYDCKDHLQPLMKWIPRHAETCGDVFEGITFKSAGRLNVNQQKDSETAEDDAAPSCVSWRPISLNYFNEAMANRANFRRFLLDLLSLFHSPT